MKKSGLPSLSTDGLRIKELYDKNDKEYNAKEEEGTNSRKENLICYSQTM